jgi:hypothetical protein
MQPVQIDWARGILVDPLSMELVIPLSKNGEPFFSTDLQKHAPDHPLGRIPSR